MGWYQIQKHRSLLTVWTTTVDQMAVPVMISGWSIIRAYFKLMQKNSKKAPTLATIPTRLKLMIFVTWNGSSSNFVITNVCWDINVLGSFKVRSLSDASITMFADYYISLQIVTFFSKCMYSYLKIDYESNELFSIRSLFFSSHFS